MGREVAVKVLLCKDDRVRKCRPIPLRPLPFHSRFYVSSEMQVCLGEEGGETCC